MKVRFYRGPLDGKVKELHRDITQWTVATLDRKAYWITSTYPTESLEIKHHYFKTQHTHPDGSVFFEWDKPRGSRIK